MAEARQSCTVAATICICIKWVEVTFLCYLTLICAKARSGRAAKLLLTEAECSLGGRGHSKALKSENMKGDTASISFFLGT